MAVMTQFGLGQHIYTLPPSTVEKYMIVSQEGQEENFSDMPGLITDH